MRGCHGWCFCDLWVCGWVGERWRRMNRCRVGPPSPEGPRAFDDDEKVDPAPLAHLALRHALLGEVQALFVLQHVDFALLKSGEEVRARNASRVEQEETSLGWSRACNSRKNASFSPQIVRLGTTSSPSTSCGRPSCRGSSPRKPSLRRPPHPRARATGAPAAAGA